MQGGSDGAECTRGICALAHSACRHGPLLDGTPETFDASTRLFFALVGVPMPAARDEWPTLIQVAADAGGPQEAARGLELAARTPPTAPASGDGQWWTKADAQRAEALAADWRQRTAKHPDAVEAEAA
jgi:hypothetical protein